MQIFGYPTIAKRYGKTPPTIAYWVKHYGFPAPYKLGGRYYWELAEIEAWEEEKGVRPRGV